MSRLLRFVVERTLDGRADEIKEYVLGTEVFDRGPDYDPRLDSIVRVEARRLRTKLDEYYSGPGASDPVLIRIRRGTYVPEFGERTVAPAAGSASAEGLADGVDAAPDDRQPRRRSVLFIGATLGALAIAAVAAQVVRWPGPTSAESTVPRLAVLPFAHYPPGESNQALADRMTDGVTTALVRVDRLEIVSRTSASQFAREPRPMGEVARALDADWVVEGTVFIENGTIRAAVRLVDPSRDRKVWAQDFEGSPNDLQGLERRIAEGVDRTTRASPARLR
jgi:TolB-like protein